MAVYAGVAVGKPLRLKDFLELDCDSCSAAGFRCYPRRLCVAGVSAAAAGPSPVRQLLEAPRGFGRSHSLRRHTLSHLSRSLSRRLRGGFSWMRREEEPAPSVAACSQEVAVSSTCYSSSSDSETSESGSSSSTEIKSESDYSSASSESPHAGAAAATTAEDEHEAMKGESKEAGSGPGSETDHEKEQLSPVAVMDFPFDDDDDVEDTVEEEGRDGGNAACSSSFSENLVQLQRRKTQLQHNIRRFGNIGELGAVDLEARFAASDSDRLGNVPAQQQRQCCTDACATAAPPRRHNNGDRSIGVYRDLDEHGVLGLGLLTCTVLAAAGVDAASERLLLDFFAETVQKVSTPENGEAAVGLAKRWLDGTGPRWGLKEALCSREDLVTEMERSRRWSASVGGEGEKHEVGVVVAGLVIGELVDELVSDLLVQV